MEPQTSGHTVEISNAPRPPQRPRSVMPDARPMYRTIKAVWYILAVIESLLLLRLLMRMLGANEVAGFTQFVYGLSGFFLAPFQFVFNTLTVGRFAIEPSTILAMIVYWLIAWGIVRLILLPRAVPRSEAERVLEDQDVE